MGCRKLTYYESKTAIGENWKIFASGIEKTVSSSIFCKDYYAFGSLQPGRYTGGNLYRYGFNGKENDNEVKGNGNQQDYGYRIYDPRLGKFLSVDPLSPDYPWYTPYQFAGNKPIWAIDLDGLEELVYQYTLENGKATLLKKISNAEIKMQGPTIQTQKPVVYDKRTGKPMAKSEIGKVQYQYFDKDGNRMYKRRNVDGDYVGGENELMDIGAGNLFGSIYIGPFNPTVVDPETGKERGDYRREPQDEADAAAMRHDLAYDEGEATGFGDALFNRKVRPADVDLVNSANQTAQKARQGGVDEMTGKPVTSKTASRANLVSIFFSWVLRNTKPVTPRPSVNSSDNPGLLKPGESKM